MGLDHNLAVRFLGSCACPCHPQRRTPAQGAPGACWCHGIAAHPYAISHNDAVRHFGACPSRDHVACRTRTETQWQRAFDEAERRDQDRRIARGEIRNSSDLSRAIRTGRYPFGRRP